MVVVEPDLNTPTAISRRTLTIADLKPSSRIPEPSQVRSVSKPTIAANTPMTIRPAQARVTPPVPTTPAPCVVERDTDGFPCGWCFDAYSWGFHRSLWAEHGIRLDVGEYSAIKQQCRAGTGERLQPDIWRVRLRSGRPIIVAMRKLTPLVVLPDTGWQQHGALARNMPDPPSTPRHGDDRTTTQKSRRTQKRRNQRARRRAERLAQAAG